MTKGKFKPKKLKRNKIDNNKAIMSDDDQEKEACRK